MKLLEIGKAWFEFLRGSTYTQNLMEKRLEICDACPHKVQMNALGIAIVTTLNEKASLYKCGLCHCPLSALTSNPNISCKDDRWGPAGEQSYY